MPVSNLSRFDLPKLTAAGLILKLTLVAGARPAWAHASEQGFVLLLPTDLYTWAGVLVVLATVVALIFTRPAHLNALTRAWPLPRVPRALPMWTSLGAALLLWLLIWAGGAGPRDPLANPLTLMIWTVFWIGAVSVQGTLFDIWRYISPFTAVALLLRPRKPARLRGGAWPAVAGFFGFAYILLADPAPTDPARLARWVGVYWAAHMGLTLWFGPRWLVRGETMTVFMRLMRRVAICGNGRLGLPGWQISATSVSLPLAVLAVSTLAIGSFDGLNETFWWLGKWGINPFEYPGRSGVVLQSTLGMALAVALVMTLFLTALWLGLRLAGGGALRPAFLAFAPTLLPIAVGYHIAHYLPSFLVDGQWALVALSDPFLTGADLLGLGEFYVSTGFFNTKASVRVIYLTQASAVVIGHVIAVLTAHATALRLFHSHRAAILSQAPLALLMIAYTFFGLWLLASPRF